jgi:hypothetical protein
MTEAESEIDRLQLALLCVVRADEIAPWFERPNGAFDGATPRALVERGESHRLWRMVGELEAGTGS